MYFLDAFMDEEIAEFEIGKRHLATIMGADPDMFTQDDIDVRKNSSFIYICIIINYR